MAVLAVLNCLAAGVLAGWLVGTGRLDAERGRQIVSLLGGEAGAADAEEPGEDAPQSSETAGESTVGSPSLQANDLVEDEMRWRNTDRYRAQIEQRLKFINAVKLDVERQREELERLKEQERLAAEQRANEVNRPGYQKELDILESLSPKAALRQIMTMDDADAARVVFELDDRKVKRLFESAKTAAEIDKLTRVRELLRDIKPVPADSNGNT